MTERPGSPSSGIDAVPSSRLAAVDIARGLAMLLVVAMHSIGGVEQSFDARGAMHALVDFATSFRVPAFFLISGLFLRRAMQLGWIDLYAKRLHGLIVLYLVWLAIHLFLRSLPAIHADPVGGIIGRNGYLAAYLRGLVEPYGMLWFIHLMIVLIIVARAVFLAPRALPVAILAAAVLESVRISTGYTLVDEFAARLFYFLAGLWLAPFLLPGGRKGPRAGVVIAEPHWLSAIRERPGLIAIALAAWFVVQVAVVHYGIDRMAGMSLMVGLAGTAALLLSGLLLVQLWPDAWLTRGLLLIGQRSIVIYLVFSIPMAIIREGLLRIAPGLPVDLVSALVICGSVAVALAVERLARDSWLEPLFSRPVLSFGPGSRGG